MDQGSVQWLASYNLIDNGDGGSGFGATGDLVGTSATPIDKEYKENNTATNLRRDIERKEKVLGISLFNILIIKHLLPTP